MSTPPPPSPTLVVEEQAPAEQLGSPMEDYQRAIPEALRARVDKDAELRAFFVTLPTLFQSAQKIRTTTPLKAHKQIYAQETTTFTRINDGGDVIGDIHSITDQIDPEI